jgi:hypothetical protein
MPLNNPVRFIGGASEGIIFNPSVPFDSGLSAVGLSMVNAPGFPLW